MSIGIIAEYNPFHNGHLYHLEEIKKMYPNSTIILVTNSYFTQRGDISLINKWNKVNLALEFGIDLVVELPFAFATQSADLFAKGAVEILNYLKVDKIVFGSESNDINLLKNIAGFLSNNDNMKEFLKEGNSYPSAISKMLNEKYNVSLKEPNDILGVCYIKELIRLKSDIEPVCIKRTNDYNSLKLEKICSAKAIRESLKTNNNISNYVPDIEKYLDIHFVDELFPFIKYKIISSKDLNKYQTVDEGIEYRLKKYIYESNSLEEFIDKVKTKRYAYNRIKRMLIHILCNFTKEEAKDLETEYIRILGFNDKGRKFLNERKKTIDIPLITSYKKFKNLDIEIKSTAIYSLLENNDLLKKEFCIKPYKK